MYSLLLLMLLLFFHGYFFPCYSCFLFHDAEMCRAKCRRFRIRAPAKDASQRCLWKVIDIGLLRKSHIVSVRGFGRSFVEDGAHSLFIEPQAESVFPGKLSDLFFPIFLVYR